MHDDKSYYYTMIFSPRTRLWTRYSRTQGFYSPTFPAPPPHQPPTGDSPRALLGGDHFYIVLPPHTCSLQLATSFLLPCTNTPSHDTHHTSYSMTLRDASRFVTANGSTFKRVEIFMTEMIINLLITLRLLMFYSSHCTANLHL